MDEFITKLYGSLIRSNIFDYQNTTVCKSHFAFQDLAKPDENPRVFEMLFSNKTYVPREIIEPHKLKSCTKYHIIDSKKQVNLKVVFIHGQNTESINKEFILAFIKNVINLLHNYTEIQTYDITIIPTRHRKVFPQSNSQDGVSLNSLHVNTGVCTRYLDGQSNIIVYRREELCKVLLHELLHLHKCDFIDSGNNLCRDVLQKVQTSLTLKVRTENIRFNEAYNDVITLLLYIGLFIKYRRPQFFKTFIKFKIQYKGLLKKAQNYIYNTAARICVLSDNKFNESTPVFSYYFGKAILLSNIENIIKNFMSNKYMLQNREEYVASLCDKVINYEDYEKFIAEMNQIISMLSRKKTIAHTLRMINLEIYPTDYEQNWFNSHLVE
jgi:hypothetical protein